MVYFFAFFRTQSGEGIGFCQRSIEMRRINTNWVCFCVQCEIQSVEKLFYVVRAIDNDQTNVSFVWFFLINPSVQNIAIFDHIFSSFVYIRCLRVLNPNNDIKHVKKIIFIKQPDSAHLEMFEIKQKNEFHCDELNVLFILNNNKRHDLNALRMCYVWMNVKIEESDFSELTSIQYDAQIKGRHRTHEQQHN